MRSVIAQGHRLVLWHYSPLDGVPEGAELRDGDAIIPRERLFRHVPTGSYSLFSNLFRYRLMQLGHGIWLDCDAYLLEPLKWDGGYLFGYGEPDVIATGLLAMPADSPILTELISYYDGKRIPFWLRKRWWLRFAIQRLLTGRYSLEAMPWGYLGPYGLTALVRKYGLLDQVRPQAEFFPWTWRDTDWVRSANETLEQHVTPETRALHLYNHVIGAWKDTPAEPGSFLARLQHEGA